jgi:Flp pilus assembly protein TadG
MASLLRRVRSHKGAALIEVALTLPLLLLVSVGIFEFGRAYQTWQVVTNASREGARVAILPEYTDASVVNRVKTYLKNGGLPAAIVDGANTKVLITETTIPIAVGGGTTATAARIVVEYPFEFMVLQPVAKLVVSGSTAGDAFTMRMTTIMRNE